MEFTVPRSPTTSPTIAIGPVMPGWGSWDWLGADLAAALADRYRTTTFHGSDVPECDAAIIVKHALPTAIVEELARRSAVLYAPVDAYGRMADVDADHRMLRRCDRIVVHSERLRKCFGGYARVEYVDHHLKFTSEDRLPYRAEGELLWVGVRTNVPALGAWLERHEVPGPIRVLTNFENPDRVPEPGELGLPDGAPVLLEHWTPERHRQRLAEARAAIDVKGAEFRQWHKPPAKALDFLAAGLPLAMNCESSAATHLRERYGFELCTPDDTDRWFSRAYWEETRAVAGRLRRELSLERVADRWGTILDETLAERGLPERIPGPPMEAVVSPSDPPVRVAVVSLLFEWPTKGGGNVHTYELVGALGRAGYDVRHLIIRSEPWGTGGLAGALPYDHEVLAFDEQEWSLRDLRDRLRAAVDRFDPDSVIVTDSWNAKPVLAEALADYPTILRLQALECLCPLDNVRLLPGLVQCDGNQLADPGRCRRCLLEHGPTSGPLHRAERALCGVGSDAYDEVLHRAFAEAEAVLVVNDETRRLVEPHARRTVVAPSGFDPARFPWPWPEPDAPREVRRILFAGHPTEPIKGYSVLREACRRLWERRRDFELVVTGDPLVDPAPFERFAGWQSQEALPGLLRSCDVTVVPSIAQEALGRVAVESQAVGRPVVASRIGGLPTTVADRESGLLFEPGDPADLAGALGRLLDDGPLRERLGAAGRRRFERHYTWERIVEECYRPLLVRRVRGGTP